MSFEDIKFLIDEIPKYIQYFYPGYITIYLYYFFRGLTLKDTKNTIIKSIGISYFYIVLLNTVLRAGYASLEYNIWLIIIAVITAYICYMVIDSESFRETLEGLYISTTTTLNEIDALRDIDEKKRAWLKVYLKNDHIVYEGSLRKHESEQDRRSFIILSGYLKYRIEDDETEKLILDYKFKNRETVLIYSEDISRIESVDIKRINEYKDEMNVRGGQ